MIGNQGVIRPFAVAAWSRTGKYLKCISWESFKGPLSASLLFSFSKYKFFFFRLPEPQIWCHQRSNGSRGSGPGMGMLVNGFPVILVQGFRMPFAFWRPKRCILLFLLSLRQEPWDRVHQSTHCSFTYRDKRVEAQGQPSIESETISHYPEGSVVSIPSPSR